LRRFGQSANCRRQSKSRAMVCFAPSRVS